MLRLNTPERKLQLIIILMLVPLVPWQLGGRQPVAILVSTLALGLALYLQWGRERFQPSNRSGLPWPLIALIAWGALSLFWSVNRYQTITWLLVAILGWAVYSLARAIGNEPGSVRWWINGYLGVATIYGLYGLFIYLTDSYERLTSSFYLANAFAIYALPAVLLAVWCYVRFKNWWYLLAAGITLATLILADSRTVFVMLALGALSLIATKFKRREWLRLGAVLMLALALAGAANGSRALIFHHATAVAGARFAQVANGEASNGSDRLYYLRSAWLIWTKYPVGGSGAGTFASIHPKYQQRVVSAALSAHNLYAQTAAELGLIGELGLLAVAFIGLRLALNSWQQRRYRILAVIVVVMLIHFGLDIDTIYPPVVAIFAIAMGFLVANLKFNLNKKNIQSALATPTALIVIVIACVLAGGAYFSDHSRVLAQSAQNDGDYEAAAASFAAVRSWHIYDPDVLTAQGINLYTLSIAEPDSAKAKADLEQARSLAKQAERLDQYDAQHWLLEARVLLRLGDKAGAIQAYEAAITRDPYNHPEYYADLASTYAAIGKTHQAVEVYTTILKQYTPSVIANRSFIPGLTNQLSELYYLRAVTSIGQADNQSIKNDLRSALRLNPSNASAESLLSQLGS